ncbi:hypothetical protein WS62_11835 [Burkholderia sp. ABCPW 14]|nr:hypothetical protein WS62_11835 [Burkholderia sp. ABCPW 14]
MRRARIGAACRSGNRAPLAAAPHASRVAPNRVFGAAASARDAGTTTGRERPRARTDPPRARRCRRVRRVRMALRAEFDALAGAHDARRAHRILETHHRMTEH